jgi:homospermidine synthase
LTELSIPRRVVILGCGSVAQCLLPLLLDHFGLEPSTVKVIESRDNRDRIASSIAKGVQYLQFEITRENLTEVLAENLGDGDLLIDLAWNIDLTELLDWCRDHNVRYLNTSVEVWDPYMDPASTSPQERTLYHRHMALRRQLQRWGRNDGPSAVVEHGANPGLVSHYTKQALVDIANAVVRDGLLGDRHVALNEAIATGQFNMLNCLA